jgi:uncharacterized protein (TIGR02646 family)
MLKYTIGALSLTTMAKLAQLQARVDALPTHAARYELANQLFSNKSNPHFEEVKAKLAELAPGGDACYYCERDRFRDIEHIRPKRHYPEHCFDWFNYVCACTICNQDRKKDTFAIFGINGEIQEFNRTWDIATPLPQGQQVLIDLRTEDPMDFLQLDLATGMFVPIGDELAKKRGKWSCDLFRLNDAGLARMRKNALQSFSHYLGKYQQALAANDGANAELVLDEIRQFGQPTVLVEMRRQAVFLPELSALFNGIPADIGVNPPDKLTQTQSACPEQNYPISKAG